MKPESSPPPSETAVQLFDNWFDPIEAGLRDRVHEFIQAMIEGELDLALSRRRYARHAKRLGEEAEVAVGAIGHRHGHRSRCIRCNRRGAFAVIGIDIGKNSFHVVGLDTRGAIVLRQKWSRGQVEARLARVHGRLDGGPIQGMSFSYSLKSYRGTKTGEPR